MVAYLLFCAILSKIDERIYQMLHIGAHLASSKGFTGIASDALKIGADTFQFFTRNPQGFKAKDIDESDVQNFLKISQEHHFEAIQKPLLLSLTFVILIFPSHQRYHLLQVF